jgi:7,8-dihydro-6-hydroxymethylpterin-pyrophosphokinase
MMGLILTSVLWRIGSVRMKACSKVISLCGVIHTNQKAYLNVVVPELPKHNQLAESEPPLSAHIGKLLEILD